MSMELLSRLPYDHPYRWDGTKFGSGKLWRPSDLGADLALWLDAEDTDSITLNGSTVSQWDDKSGNDRHVSQVNATQQPAFNAGALSNKPILTFDGVNDTLQRASAGLSGLSSVSIFVVMRYITGGNNEDIPIGVGSANNEGAIRTLYRLPNGTTQGWANWSKDVGGSAFSCDIGGGYHIFAGWNTSLVAGNNIVIARDGLSAVYTNSNGNLTTTVDGLGIGELVGSTIRYTNAAIAEVIILPVAVTASQQRLIEGYLAWKWDLVGNLPADHPYKTQPPFVIDPEAQKYLRAVEAADGQRLEEGVRLAVNDFVVGCKEDGIWDAIKASCILAGARTLGGALVPLTGAAPTNFNFVAGDYERATGLVGDGSTKYLDANITDNEQGITLNDMHLAVYKTETGSTDGLQYLIGANDSEIYTNFGSLITQSRGGSITSGAATDNNFIGWSRSTSTGYNYRVNSVTTAQVLASTSVSNTNIGVFARTTPAINGTHRLSFYSIGESVDLAKLEARVSTLITAIGAAV